MSFFYGVYSGHTQPTFFCAALWGILGIEGGNIASHRESMFVFGDDVIFEMSQPWRLFFDSPAKKNLAAITVNFRFMLAKHYPAFCGSCLERHFL